MIVALAAAVLSLGVALQQTDTTFAVRAGGRLMVDAHDGAAVVGVWDRQQVRVQATHEPRGGVSIRRTGSDVRVEAEGYHGPARGVRLQITVPREFGVVIEGINVGASVDGVRGDVDVENVEGDVAIRNVIGNVSVESVSGSVVVENVRGNVSASSTNQGFRMSGVRGNVEAETTNGSIVMRSMDAGLVEASTINGMIEYDGTIRDDGRYYLGAFNGQISMSVPERANASITVRTANGRIVSAFAVPLQSMRENRVSFTVGTGSARVELDSHNGSIHLVRPRGR